MNSYNAIITVKGPTEQSVKDFIVSMQLHTTTDLDWLRLDYTPSEDGCTAVAKTCQRANVLAYMEEVADDVRAEYPGCDGVTFECEWFELDESGELVSA